MTLPVDRAIDQTRQTAHHLATYRPTSTAGIAPVRTLLGELHRTTAGLHPGFRASIGSGHAFSRPNPGWPGDHPIATGTTPSEEAAAAAR